MDYIPPPIATIEYIMPARAQQQGSTINQLIISIDEASYDKEKGIATISMSKAFQKSHIIQSYFGNDIALIYKGETLDLNNCPPVRVSISNIKRDINFLNNTVTLSISNIEQNLADKISTTHCLLIDTKTVKKVSNPNYEAPIPIEKREPFSRLNQ